MTAVWLLLAFSGAFCFYLGSAHQGLWPSLKGQASALRALGGCCLAAALLTAMLALGPWAGVFAVLTAVMAMLVLLPYLDAWRRLRAGSSS